MEQWLRAQTAESDDWVQVSPLLLTACVTSQANEPHFPCCNTE